VAGDGLGRRAAGSSGTGLSGLPTFGPQAKRLPEMKAVFTEDRARSVAMNMIARQAAVYPEFMLDPLDEADLTERDAAFAHAIYDVTIRRWITLGYLIERYTPRGLRENDPAIQAALLAGSAQMLFLDKVPPHAAINASVEWVKHAASPSIGGFVNAVLRKVVSLAYDPSHLVPPNIPSRVSRATWTNRADELPLSEGDCLALRAAVLPTDPTERTAVATSHQAALVRHWVRVLGQETAMELCLHDVMAAPITLCTRYAKGELPEAMVPHKKLAVGGDVSGQASGNSVGEAARPTSHIWTGSRFELSAVLASRRDLWVQDAASSHPVVYLGECIQKSVPALLAGELRIIDLCAGQGTKTRQLAAEFVNAEIVAADPAPDRAKALAQVVATIGPRARAWTVSDVHGRLQRSAGVVMVDVPCTNTGVLSRRAEARYRCDEVQLARLVETQREIVTKAVRLLAPGGVFCYSTCSVEPAENDEQTAWIMAQFGMRLLGTHRWMPTGKPGDAPELYSDASYCAVLTGS